ncbi:hypothetical protein ACVR1G_06775 [Streptococcus dentasini]
MESNNLASINAKLGLYGGGLALVLRLLKWSIFSYMAIQSTTSDDEALAGLTYLVFAFISLIIKIVTFIYGLLAKRKYSGQNNIPSAAHTLFIIALPVNISFGFIADISCIIGGYFYKQGLKDFKE